MISITSIKKRFQIILIVFLAGSNLILAQSPYKSLRQNDNNAYFIDSTGITSNLKNIKIGNGNLLHIGGNFRHRWRYYDNPNWGDLGGTAVEDPNGYHWHRYQLHGDLLIKQRIRLFAQLNAGWLSGWENPDRPYIDKTLPDFQTLFAEWYMLQSDANQLSLRIGRFEQVLGSGRLETLREGPNIRQPNDGAMLLYKNIHKLDARAFAYKPVLTNNGWFDYETDSTLFIFGAQVQKSATDNFSIDLAELTYYGISREHSNSDEELRHSVGLRSQESIGRFTVRGEYIYQFGKREGFNISASWFTMGVMYSQKLGKQKFSLAMDVHRVSGDKSDTDTEINTFYTPASKPHMTSVISLGPANLEYLETTFKYHFSTKLFIIAKNFIAKRSSTADGLYPPDVSKMFRPMGGAAASDYVNENIGIISQLEVEYHPNIHTRIVPEAAYITAGDFMKETGAGKNITYFGLRFYLAI